MPSIRELKSRIVSVESTKKITKAQELIASSRIAKAQQLVAAAEPYSRELTRALHRIANSSTKMDHVLLTERPAIRRSGIVVLTSDRGMCGSYNVAVLREADRLAANIEQRDSEPVYFVCGAKGLRNFAFRDKEYAHSWQGFSQSPSIDNAKNMSYVLQRLIVAGSNISVSAKDLGLDHNEESIQGIDELFIVHSHFVSLLSQKPTVLRIAPMQVEYDEVLLDANHGASNPVPGAITSEFSFEPSPEFLLPMVLPLYVEVRIYACLLDASAAESASRRAAMKSATDNASDLSKTLKQEVNKARQAQITGEISEIVGAGAALGS